MKKPIKPRKPSKNDPMPYRTCTKEKLLVMEEKTQKVFLIDRQSHPKAFWNSDDLLPNIDELFNLGFCSDCFENVAFSTQQEIHGILHKDFIVIPEYNEDNYYSHTVVRFNTPNENFEKEYEKYERRFEDYEKALIVYEKELETYLEFQKQKKKQKLLKELGELK